MALRNVLAGGHGLEAEVEDIGGQEAQLGRLELTQEWSEPGRILSAKFGDVPSLQNHSKYLRCD